MEAEVKLVLIFDIYELEKGRYVRSYPPLSFFE